MSAFEWVPWKGPTRGTLKSGVHTFNRKILNWPYCGRCGLLALKNEATRRAMRQACVVEE